MMKCIICHGEEIVKKKVKEECFVGKDIVYVPVDVLECSTCGERYYSRKSKRYLEDIQKKLKEHSVKLKDIGKVKTLAA